MKTTKRYTRAQAEQLLVRLVSVTESPFSAKRTRAVLATLLEARLNDVRIVDPTAIEKIKTDRPSMLKDFCIRGVREVLRGPRAPGQRLALQATLHLSADDTCVDVEGPLGNLIAVQTLTLLRMVGPEKVRTCDCGRLFVRTGKRTSCSERCQKRVYMRRFRAGEAGKE
jgi:hypothetical protein